MKSSIVVVTIMIVSGCFPSFHSTEKDKLYLKELSDSTINVDWFFYSTVSTTTPDYLIAYKGNEIDTICIAENIADVDIRGNEIMVQFYGKPQAFNKTILIPDYTLGYTLVVDTSLVSDGPKPRKYYKKK